MHVWLKCVCVCVCVSLHCPPPAQLVVVLLALALHALVDGHAAVHYALKEALLLSVVRVAVGGCTWLRNRLRKRRTITLCVATPLWQCRDLHQGGVGEGGGGRGRLQLDVGVEGNSNTAQGFIGPLPK
jgi:hypothetical protein